MKRIPLIFTALLAVLFAGEVFALEVTAGAARIAKPVKTFKEIRNRYIVRQSLDYSCGPASLATLLSYYFQDKVTEAQIIKSLILTTDLEKIKKKKGFSLLDLKNFAEMRGYEVIGYRMGLEDLVELNQPVLVPITIKQYNHFVIFRGLRGDRVFLADPAMGNITMRAEKFQALWQGGIGLVLSKAGKRHKRVPLELTKDEKAIFADPAMVYQVLRVDLLGKVRSDSEF